ncbi:type II secretion system protein [Pseudomonadota bacterium]
MKKSTKIKTHTIKNHSKAFTLIELSVVMMIIALLVVGIVGGTRLVKNAKMAKLISETSDYIKEFNIFYDRYEAFPGDFDRANTMFGTADVNGETIHEGDGNDLIGSDDYTDTESAGFFHHLYVSGIKSEPVFTGNDVDGEGNSGTNDLISSIDEVVIDTNFPSTPFGRKTFFYVANSDVDGRYIESNRIVIATKDTIDENSMTPDDAETLDIKTDDGNPFKGKVLAYNEGLTSGASENDSGCTNLTGYDTDSGDVGCISETSLEDQEVQFDPTFAAANPGFGDLGAGGSGGGDGDGSEDDCRIPAVSTYTGLESWITYSAGDLMELSSTVDGTCSTGYSGTPVITCIENNAWDMTGPCVASACTVPVIDETGYENITAWIDTSDSSSVTSGEYIDETGTIEGTCDSGYAGSPQTTCTTAPTWDALTESCDAGSCVSEACTTDPSNYCGDNWDCTSGTCCNNSINGDGTDTSLEIIMGDCFENCTSSNMGDDVINNVVAYALGDCFSGCSGTMGNDIIDNVANHAFGDCYLNCSGTMGDDTISNALGSTFGDCQSNCSGTMGNDTITNCVAIAGDCDSDCSGIMGNDTIIDIGMQVSGDCNSTCGGITQWATDIFRNTGSNSFTIYDFNAGGVDDKIELPSGVTTSISGTGYARSLTYAGSYSGTITIECDSGNHDCDTGGSWVVVPCQVFVGGTSLSSDATPCGGNCSAVGFDTGTCSFND